MSFKEPNDPRSSEIDNNQIQLTELVTYEEKSRSLKMDVFLKTKQNKTLALQIFFASTSKGFVWETSLTECARLSKQVFKL